MAPIPRTLALMAALDAFRIEMPLHKVLFGMILVELVRFMANLTSWNSLIQESVDVSASSIEAGDVHSKSVKDESEVCAE